MEMASPRPVAIPNLPAVNSNSSWWVDSCFNAHVTTDSSQFTNATNATEYSGEDHISVGSGQSLPISHRLCGNDDLVLEFLGTKTTNEKENAGETGTYF
ncbi:uncharacterized protein LOC111018462 isoform X3 [Momordica charantia]|uniref:Uncharacterized protein LOC111018462 isoform X3 n=1 Tax=Momordica charantia TaxID=3673 RepID=A0A6J1DAZ4_MOMCH|nr:uncharacterized protein LOC111018462 isoform X3 [Momordica charantia]